MIFSFSIFIVGLAVVEGVLKPAITKWTKRGVLKYVPRVLNALDPVLPEWLNRYTEEQLRYKVMMLIYEVVTEDEPLSEDKAEKILKATVETYSFLVNAAKIQP